MKQDMSVEELRKLASLHKGMTPESSVMAWAADEIERLQGSAFFATVDRLQKYIEEQAAEIDTRKEYTDMMEEKLNDPLTGLAAVERQLAQSSLNTGWLLAKIDRIHTSLCPGSSGTWQQRAEHAVKHALEIELQRGLVKS